MSSEALFADDPFMAMVAGEASGDLLASGFLSHLKSSHPQLSVEGVAGPRMTAQGMLALYPSDRLAVRGYWEVLRHYRGIVNIRADLIRRWQDAHRKPACFIGVDAPDFNLELALALKSKGIPTFQYVCPAIWAWRAERIHLMKRALDHVWCLFPFEERLLNDQGMKATYVGHPLAHWIPPTVDRDAAVQALGLSASQPVVALMPGSRKAEIDGLLERFLKTAQQLLKHHPGLQLVLPALPVFVQRITQAIELAGLDKHILVLKGRSHEALAAADLVLVASGTATLEAALFKKPMVIAYHMPWLTWQITRRKKQLPWVGLPNILCQEWVVPELLQDDCSVEALTRESLRLLSDPQAVAHIVQRFSSLHELLRRPTHELMVQTLSSHLNHAAAV